MSFRKKMTIQRINKDELENILIKRSADNNKILEHLFQAQKMESFIRLSGGIVHDFNNVLGSIKGHIDILKSDYGENPHVSNLANKININVERAADLSHQIINFTKDSDYLLEPLDINDLIQQIIKLCEPVFEKKIQVLYNLEIPIKNIEVDRKKIYQVLTNIIINAKDSMPDGGNLTISTKNVFLSRHFIKKHSELNSKTKQGDYVKVSVKDSGFGMEINVKEKIFKPFYTTKKDGRGTGLGLYMTQHIIKNHKGDIMWYTVNPVRVQRSIYIFL